jgi:very-short-patch-repair endonuclease
VEIFHRLHVEGTGERAIGLAASQQRGLVHRLQLVAAGLSRGAIARRRDHGGLYLVLPRVYAVGHESLQPLARELAALLYLGHDAVISHLSAAMLWGLVDSPARVVQATIIGRDSRRRPGLETHRVDGLDPRDVRLRHGIPVTAPARTLLDVAGLGKGAVFERALSEARVLRLTSDRELSGAIARCPLRTGVAPARALLASERGTAALTRSDAERRLLAMIVAAGLPRPDVNAFLHGFEVDLLWREAKLVVEVDGHAFHGHRAAFERDRRRDQVLTAAGYRVIRVTWRQLEHEPLAVMARIAQALAVPPGR